MENHSRIPSGSGSGSSSLRYQSEGAKGNGKTVPPRKRPASGPGDVNSQLEPGFGNLGPFQEPPTTWEEQQRTLGLKVKQIEESVSVVSQGGPQVLVNQHEVTENRFKHELAQAYKKMPKYQGGEYKSFGEAARSHKVTVKGTCPAFPGPLASASGPKAQASSTPMRTKRTLSLGPDDKIVAETKVSSRVNSVKSSTNRNPDKQYFSREHGVLGKGNQGTGTAVTDLHEEPTNKGQKTNKNTREDYSNSAMASTVRKNSGAIGGEQKKHDVMSISVMQDKLSKLNITGYKENRGENNNTESLLKTSRRSKEKIQTRETEAFSKTIDKMNKMTKEIDRESKEMLEKLEKEQKTRRNKTGNMEEQSRSIETEESPTLTNLGVSQDQEEQKSTLEPESSSQSSDTERSRTHEIIKQAKERRNKTKKRHGNTMSRAFKEEQKEEQKDQKRGEQSRDGKRKSVNYETSTRTRFRSIEKVKGLRGRPKVNTKSNYRSSSSSSPSTMVQRLRKSISKSKSRPSRKSKPSISRNPTRREESRKSRSRGPPEQEHKRESKHRAERGSEEQERTKFDEAATASKDDYKEALKARERQVEILKYMVENAGRKIEEEQDLRKRMERSIEIKGKEAEARIQAEKARAERIEEERRLTEHKARKARKERKQAEKDLREAAIEIEEQGRDKEDQDEIIEELQVKIEKLESRQRSERKSKRTGIPSKKERRAPKHESGEEESDTIMPPTPNPAKPTPDNHQSKAEKEHDIIESLTGQIQKLEKEVKKASELRHKNKKSKRDTIVTKPPTEYKFKAGSGPTLATILNTEIEERIIDNDYIREDIRYLILKVFSYRQAGRAEVEEIMSEMSNKDGSKPADLTLPETRKRLYQKLVQEYEPDSHMKVPKMYGQDELNDLYYRLIQAIEMDPLWGKLPKSEKIKQSLKRMTNGENLVGNQRLKDMLKIKLDMNNIIARLEEGEDINIGRFLRNVQAMCSEDQGKTGTSIMAVGSSTKIGHTTTENKSNPAAFKTGYVDRKLSYPTGQAGYQAQTKGYQPQKQNSNQNNQNKPTNRYGGQGYNNQGNGNNNNQAQSYNNTSKQGQNFASTDNRYRADQNNRTQQGASTSKGTQEKQHKPASKAPVANFKTGYVKDRTPQQALADLEAEREKQKAESQREQQPRKTVNCLGPRDLYRRVKNQKAVIEEQAKRVKVDYATGGEEDEEYLALMLEFRNGTRMKGAVDTGCMPDGAITPETVDALDLRNDLYQEFTPVLAANNVEIDATQVLITEVRAGLKTTTVKLIVMELAAGTGILIGKPALQRLDLSRSLENALRQADRELEKTYEIPKNC